MPHKPGHKKDEPGGSAYKGPGGSSGGAMSRGLPPLRRVVEPGFMKKARTRPVAAKPTRFDNRRVAK